MPLIWRGSKHNFCVLFHDQFSNQKLCSDLRAFLFLTTILLCFSNSNQVTFPHFSFVEGIFDDIDELEGVLDENNFDELEGLLDENALDEFFL